MLGCVRYACTGNVLEHEHPSGPSKGHARRPERPDTANREQSTGVGGDSSDIPLDQWRMRVRLGVGA